MSVKNKRRLARSEGNARVFQEAHMAASKKGDAGSKQVRKSVTVEEDKLARVRAALGVSSDAEVLRIALDHLLEHFPEHQGEEE